ncbi:MAG: penicillin-binding protein, partial [Candidatus Pacebacteria bacterium]|nr:penicillin-binding protein [Candidatus Paceibacterota bacterium]
MKIFKTKRGTLVLGLIALGFFFTAILIFWIISLKLPDFSSFESRVVASSTKIYDRTGEVLLYDVHENIKRTVIPSIEMGSNIKNATVALEDDKFYEHNGIRPLSFLRAVLVNITTGEFTQGGSTLTQQIIKNTLLTKEKTITRKVKEWVLAVKIEKVLTKEQILEIYLNEAPYGGSIYGVEEASHTYFGKKSSELTITEAAYLASLPKAPTYYSPFGKHIDALEERKNFTLKKMLSLGFITEDEYEAAKIEQVVFLPEEETGIKAPHFVFYVIEYLEQKYGEETVLSGGLRVTTTLDYEIQEKSEEVVKRKALENEGLYDANNGASVVLDSRTGEILSMVGSRDYFDDVIDGKFNVATATRQPGSA